MNGHAKNGESKADPSVVSYRPAVAMDRVKPANDNKPPLARRIFRVLWGVAVVMTVGWTLWIGLR